MDIDKKMYLIMERLECIRNSYLNPDVMLIAQDFDNARFLKARCLIWL